MKKIIYSAIIVLCNLLLNSHLFAEEKSTSNKNDILINRRVLILDFVNTNKVPDYAYLETSIPDALLDPLTKTKSFELMSRSIWGDLVKNNKVIVIDAANEKVAIETGKNNQADVVVMGSFSVNKNEIMISARAIEISSGRIMVSRTKIAGLDSSIFKTISELTESISTEMKEKMPPLPQQVITQERIKYVETNIEHSKATGQNKEINNRTNHRNLISISGGHPFVLDHNYTSGGEWNLGIGYEYTFPDSLLGFAFLFNVANTNPIVTSTKYFLNYNFSYALSPMLKINIFHGLKAMMGICISYTDDANGMETAKHEYRFGLIDLLGYDFHLGNLVISPSVLIQSLFPSNNTSPIYANPYFPNVYVTIGGSIGLAF